MIKYTIIIPFSGKELFLRGCLDGIIKTTPDDVEILVIKNKQPLTFEEVICNRVHVITTEEQLTYPQAINVGIQEAKGSYIILCDADTYALPDWFKHLTKLYHSDDTIGIVSSKLIDINTGRILDFGIGYTNYNGLHIGRDRPYQFPLMNFDRKVQSACSATMIISKDILIEAKGFDETLSYSYCDLDLCLRIKELGKEIWVANKSLVFHKGNSSDPNSNIYKNDVKGRFWALNGSRVIADMDQYFSEAFDFYKKTHRIPQSFFLLDLSTVVNKHWYYSVFKENLGLNLVDIYKPVIQCRDLSHYSLYELLSWNILKLRFPLIYFTDRFISLKNNTLWWKLRDFQNDIVIDRNGNIDNIKNILENG